MNRNLTDIELFRVCEAIASQLGLHFPIERRSILSHNLASAAKEFGFNNLTEFIQWFLSTPLNKEQMGILESYLTISETYFWREPQVFTAFTENILEELIASQKDNGKSISIWCAGCSTGEEAYSIAIALFRTIPKIQEWKIKILATDMNPKSLSKARAGVYGSWSFRNSPPWLKEFYFKRISNREYEIIPEIKEMVTFSSFNLIHENFLSSICNNHKMDVIFCRNVLMYFTNEWIIKISQNLFNSLSQEGWLIVSSSELSSDLFPQFTPVNFLGAVLYRKSDKKISISSTNTLNASSNLLINALPQLIAEIQEAKRPNRVNSKHPVLNKDVHSNKKSSIQAGVRIQDTIEPKPGFNSHEDDLNKRIISIRLLANQGNLVEALSICNETITSHKLESGLYFLQASILQELDKSHEAIKSIKQAIYIDPNDVMGHFTLGNLFIRLGNTKNAKRYFNNALELLNSISNDYILTESEGLSANNIRGIILNNLQTQKLA